MKRRIDINCDVGELVEINDLDFIPHVSSVNICCGEHAGNPDKILTAIRAAKIYGVKIGAHPSYPDRTDFGRKSMDISKEDLRDTLVEQISYIQELCNREGALLHHVKPHGALYHDVLSIEERRAVLLDVMHELNPTLRVYGFADEAYRSYLKDRGVDLVCEGFIDRRYRNDARLVARDRKGAVLERWEDVAAQLDQLMSGRVIADDGTEIRVACQTICIHSDTPHAAVWISKIVDHLNINRVEID